jgi:hypothetical protein
MPQRFMLFKANLLMPMTEGLNTYSYIRLSRQII